MLRMLNIRLATEDDRPVISEVSKHYDSNLVYGLQYLDATGMSV